MADVCSCHLCVAYTKRYYCRMRIPLLSAQLKAPMRVCDKCTENKIVARSHDTHISLFSVHTAPNCLCIEQKSWEKKNNKICILLFDREPGERATGRTKKRTGQTRTLKHTHTLIINNILILFSLSNYLLFVCVHQKNRKNLIWSDGTEEWILFCVEKKNGKSLWSRFSQPALVTNSVGNLFSFLLLLLFELLISFTYDY